MTQGEGALPQLNERLNMLEDRQKFKNKQKKPQTANSNKKRFHSPTLATTGDNAQPMFMNFTAAHQQRVNNIGHSDNAVSQSFESRVKELQFTKETSIKLNPKVVETWINETLMDAEHLDIPGIILKPEHKNPISRYNIDRLTLTNSGVPNECVDRIYRGLFVYSIGFYEMIQRSLAHADNKFSLLSNLWKVFAILLEYCCKSNYQMLISKLSKEHKEELERLEKDFNEQVTKLTENERSLKDTLDDLTKRKEELEKKMEEETLLRKKIEEEFTKNVQTHEEEVQLRLRFESKLNNMHALHRDLQAKYQRALEEIYAIENSNHQYNKLVQQQKSELIELKSEKIENESKIVYQSERIKQLVQEHELKVRQVNDMEIKFQKLNSELEAKNAGFKEYERQVYEMRLQVEANKSLIEGLTSEKTHLELSLKENKDQKEQFKEKCEILNRQHEEIFIEMQEYKKQLVGIQEIKRDRDDRIDKLRKEYDEIYKKNDILDKEHTALKVHHEHMQEDFENLKLDHDNVCEKLRQSNKVRNEKEEALNDKIRQSNAQNEQIKDKDYQIEKLKKEIEKLQKRLNEIERQNDSLEIKKKSLDKQSEIQRKQLLDKIQTLNELVSAEKDTREMWINRFEKEQKQHIATNTDLLETKSNLQDAQLKIKNYEIEIDSSSKNNESLKNSNEELQKQLSEFMARCEGLERDLFTKTELLRTVEDQHRIYIKKIRQDEIKSNKSNEQQFEQRDMIFEDLRSFCAQHWELIQQKLEKIKHLNEELEKTIELKNQTQEDLNKKIEQYDELNGKYDILQNRLIDEETNNDKLRQENIKLEERISLMNANIANLSKQVEEKRQLEKQLAAINEKASQLEISLDHAMNSGGITQNKLPSQLFNRGVQTKKIKQKERNMQTDFVETVYNNQAVYQTQPSSTMKVQEQVKKPRIVSAVQTTTTGNQSQPNFNRDPSQGFSSTIITSQGEFNFADYNQVNNYVGGGSGSVSNDNQRAIRSAAQKRHMIPSSEAIEEEQELGQSRLFKRNPIMECDEGPYLRKTPTEQYYSSSQGIISGQAYPTVMQRHQKSSKMGFRIKDDDEIKKQSQQSSKRSVGETDLLSNEILRSVYEKRVTSGTIQKIPPQIASRPMTQPAQFRQQMVQHNQGHPVLTLGDNMDTLFTPSDTNSQKFKFDIQQYQQNLQSATNNSRPQTKSSDRVVRGKASIKTLIKVATARDK